MRAGGKLVLTDGVSSVEGAAGGGLATWALIGGNETKDGIGGSAHVTYVPLADYSLTSYGAAIGIMDRVELSYTRQVFDTHKIGAALGLGKGFTFDQDVFGAKVRLLGDAVYDQDSWLPQVSVGAQYKHANRGAIIHAVGGAHDSGTDFFVSATKILLAQSLVLDGTVRATKANQFGLLGFGGDRHDRYSAQFEGSAALLLTRKLAVGGEVRTKPDNLGFAREDAAWDGFVAYSVTKNVSLTAAYVDLGSIATIKGQRGAFLSLQTSF
ncbi:DUF3034 domain-containing protein [Nostoc sp. 3335mG]|nr:DUF3034 domain-containing protein [Nostoc sp. 3335mG]